MNVMKVLNKHNALVLLLLLTILLHGQPNQARLLVEEKQARLQSLQKGPVPPSGPSGCTYIPGSGGKNCPTAINGINAAGNAFHRRGEVYPRLMVQFGVAAGDQHQKLA